MSPRIIRRYDKDIKYWNKQQFQARHGRRQSPAHALFLSGLHTRQIHLNMFIYRNLHYIDGNPGPALKEMIYTRGTHERCNSKARK